jgi:hypothetical protein
MTVDYEDLSAPIGEKHFYRLDMQGCGILVSNPIFVTREAAEEPEPQLQKKIKKTKHERKNKGEYAKKRFLAVSSG